MLSLVLTCLAYVGLAYLSLIGFLVVTIKILKIAVRFLQKLERRRVRRFFKSAF